MKIKDISKLAGVSVASVSRVINGDTHVLPATKEKVLKAIAESGYVPNLTGRMLRTQRSNKLLILVPNISNTFFSKIIKGMEDAASQFGYEMLVAITNRNAQTEKKYVAMLETKQADGAITFLSMMPRETFNTLSARFPIVQCCEPMENTSTSMVYVANRNAAREATTYLIQKNRRHIALFMGHVYYHSESERLKGYQEALRENGIPFDAQYVVDCEYEYDDAALKMDRLFEEQRVPDAVFCCSDVMAIGVVRSILAHGKTPGVDIDVIGFDNNTISGVFIPSISTVAQPRYEIGKAAVELLVEKINNPHAINKLIILPHQLILRDSTGASGVGQA